MSLGRVLWCVLLLSSMEMAQSPDAVKYAPRPIVLLSGENNVEAVMPMMFTTNTGNSTSNLFPRLRLVDLLHAAPQISTSRIYLRITITF